MNEISFPFTDPLTTEEQISLVIPTLIEFKKQNPKLSGFSGDCFAAAYAINKVLFQEITSIIGVFNEAAYKEVGRSIGHVAVHYLTDEQGTDFVDLDGFKDSSDIDSWGMLDPEDGDYQDMFTDEGIVLNDVIFEKVVWVIYTPKDIENIIDHEVLDSYVLGMEKAYNTIISLNNCDAKKLKMK